MCRVYAIITAGHLKGIVGEIIQIEMSMNEETICTLRTDCGEIVIQSGLLHPITEEQYKYIILERGTKNMNFYDWTMDLDNIKLTTTINSKTYAPKNHFNPKTIKNVIFNDPATIVIWDDGTKTVVKCQEGDVYNKEMGLAMAIIKKCMNNKGNYNDVFEKWIKEKE